MSKFTFMIGRGAKVIAEYDVGREGYAPDWMKPILAKAEKMRVQMAFRLAWRKWGGPK